MRPAAAQSAEQESATLLSTEYTSGFAVANNAHTCRRPQAWDALWDYAERSPRKSGGQQRFNRNRSA
jgi:hypothetical protein